MIQVRRIVDLIMVVVIVIDGEDDVSDGDIGVNVGDDHGDDDAV